MARLPEYVQGTLGGVPSPFRDVQTELGLRKQLWSQIVDLASDANRQLGIISGTIIVGTPVAITGPVDVSGEVTISGPVTISGDVNISSGDVNAELYTDGYPVSNTNPVYINDAWTPTTVSDVGLNDSAKSLSVPSGYEYQVLWVWAELTSDDTVGDRQLELRVHNASNDIIFQMRAGAIQPQSTSRYYAFGPDLTDLTAFRDTNYLMTPIPATLYLPAGYSVQVLDNNAISAAGDNLIVHMQVRRRTA